jgi:hypothetical protein
MASHPSHSACAADAARRRESDPAAVRSDTIWGESRPEQLSESESIGSRSLRSHSPKYQTVRKSPGRSTPRNCPIRIQNLSPEVMAQHLRAFSGARGRSSCGEGGDSVKGAISWRRRQALHAGASLVRELGGEKRGASAWNSTGGRATRTWNQGPAERRLRGSTGLVETVLGE